MESERYPGSIEIINPVTGTSLGTLGSAIDADQVPVVLEILHAITAAAPDEPEPVGESVPARQWTGQMDGMAVIAKLWREA